MCAIPVNGYFDSLIREAEKDGAFVRPSFGLPSDSPLRFMLLASVRDTDTVWSACRDGGFEPSAVVTTETSGPTATNPHPIRKVRFLATAKSHSDKIKS